MDRTPSDENADSDASNNTPEPNPNELENDIQSDVPDESATAPDNDGSSPDKIDTNESESVPESPPEVVSNDDNEPDLEIETKEQEGISEEKVPEGENLEEAPVQESPEEEASEERAPADLVPVADAPEEASNEELAPEEKAPEEIPDLAEAKEEVLVDEDAEFEVGREEDVLEADVEEVPEDVLPSEELDQEDGLQEGTTEKAKEEEASPSHGESEEQPLDENTVADSFIEYFEDEVSISEKVMDVSDSEQLEMLAAGIVTAIISSGVVPSTTQLSKELDDEIGTVLEAEENVAATEIAEETGTVEEKKEAQEAENEDELFSTPRKVVMLDKAVQAIAKEIDEALEALSAESLLVEEEAGEAEKSISAESCVASEGEAYQSCEDVTEEAEEQPCGEGRGNVPCPYLEDMLEEPAKEEGAPAVDIEDESQWEDLPEEGDENGLAPIEGAELADQQGEFGPPGSSEPSVPQDTSIPSESQYMDTPTTQYMDTPTTQYMDTPTTQYMDTPTTQYMDTPTTQGEADTPIAVYGPDTQRSDTTSKPVEANTPGTTVEEYSPIAQQDTWPKTGEDPGREKLAASLGGTKSEPLPPVQTKPRAVASDTKRPAVAQPADTPVQKRVREPCESSDWQQAFCDLKDQLLESPYNYICKFVALCVAIRAIRSILLSTRCG